MRDVFIIGAGQTPVGEHWGLGLRELGAAAIRAALDDAGLETVDALFVGNMLGGTLNGQENLGALLAEARDPQRELTLALQVARLDVEPADHHHLTMEVLQRRVIELLDDRQIRGAEVVVDEGSLRREQLDRRLGVGHEDYPSPVFSGTSRRLPTTSAVTRRSLSTDSGSPIDSNATKTTPK